ncbi:MAG: hypothetical protein IPM68_17470 [Flavobacteriales bacterium]|nr:hypothetical protein [Flavobacteriales bacterium]
MVRNIVTLLAAVLVLPTHAQFDALPDANAGWTVSFWIGPGYPYEGYFYEYDAQSPDTVIAGDVFKKLNVTNTFGFTDYGGALRDNEMGQVYFCEPGGSVPALLLDFDVVPGDTVFNVFSMWMQDVFVWSVDTVLINGTPRKRIGLACVPNPIGVSAYWIQGIGGLGGFLFTNPCGSVSGIGELVCMTANDTVQWGPNVGGVGDCALALGAAEEPEPASDLSLHPVPAEDRLYLQGVMPGAQLEVLGADGRIVLASAAPQGPLDISTLVTGVHVLRVTDVDGKVRTARFVKR